MEVGDLMVSPDLVKISEYKLKYVSYDNSQVDADKVLIYPVELGNKIEIKKSNNVLLTFPMKWIIGMASTTEKKGLLKKGDLLLKISLRKEGDAEKTLLLNVEDNKIKEIGDEIQKNFDAQKQPLWEEGGMGLHEKENGVGVTFFGLDAPFLAEGEEILWSREKKEGILNKHLRAFEAITNYRVLFHDFETHKSLAYTPIGDEEIIVTNQKRISESTRSGNFVGRGFHGGFFGGTQGFSSSESQTFGDITIMANGRTEFTLYTLSDPSGVARLLKAVRDNFKKLAKLHDEQKGIKPKTAVNSDKVSKGFCSKCGNQNLVGSKFCNKCGAQLGSACTKCGANNPDDSSFCNKCGFTLK